jgi:hypothetical protein
VSWFSLRAATVTWPRSRRSLLATSTIFWTFFDLHWAPRWER